MSLPPKEYTARMDASTSNLWAPWPRGRAEWVILLIALAVRLGLWAVLLQTPQRAFVNEDAHQYHRLAMNIWRHGAFSDSRGVPLKPAFLRAPLYPAFIAAVGGPTGSWVLVPCLAQVLIGCWTVLLTVRVSRSLLEFPAIIAWATGILAAIDLNAAGFCGMLMSETLFGALWTATVAVALWTASTRRFRVGYPALAVLLTAATFARPIGQFALPVFLVLLVVLLRSVGERVRPQLPALLAAGILFAVPFCGWIARNRSAGGPAAFTTAGNYNLFVYGCRMATHARGRRDWPTVKSDWLAELERLEADHPDEADRHAVMGKRGAAMLIEHWPQSLRELAIGIPRAFRSLAYEVFLYLGYTDDQVPPLGLATIRGQWSQHPGLLVLRVGFLLGMLVVGLASGVGLLLAWRRWRSPPLLIVATALAYLTLLGAFNSGGRFRVPMTATLLWVVGFGLAEWRRRLGARGGPTI